MKYNSLVQFEPIETIIQIREADDKKEAQRLVETFVISNLMVKKFEEILFPMLELDTSVDKKGILIVGNYGTGKSHLMSVISAIAEHDDLIPFLRNEKAQELAQKTGGKFVVVRTEIGAVTQSLRDIICGELERYLKANDVDFTFPSPDKIVNHKDAFIAMMGVFQEKYPEKGLLLVVDELLDYLRSRKETELILDLNFLREIGESCRWSGFRFIAGIQEALFDNPRFTFYASSMQRVQQRFESIHIDRTDISFVVSERLLNKTAKQKAQIRNHLQKFTAFYNDMNERMDQYVDLFPIHPEYLAIMDKLYMVEKRDVLKTLSRAVNQIIDDNVPSDAPGLISYDQYWEKLSEDRSLRTDEQINQVVEKGLILEGILKRSFKRKNYSSAAIRVIHALCVHRLTTGDVSSPIGITPQNIRDDLCIYLPIPEKDSEFLLSTIESILREITKTVSGQFISYNEENDMYYLDVKKDIDYDAKIEERAGFLDAEKLDTYYFDALAKVMKTPESTYVPGYRIWEHELVWREKNAGRIGYLFFGAPNERSTAQPPQDFYVYFLQPFDPRPFTDELKSDEVFFILSERDEIFEDYLRKYSGAMEMAGTSSGTHKSVYQSKAGEYLSKLTKWLREHIISAYHVRYRGVEKNLLEWAKEGKIPTSGDVPETINGISSYCLSPHFEELSPEYPRFPQVIRAVDRGEAVRDALKWLRGGVKTQRGTAVLEGLELLEGDQINTERSLYASYILDELRKKGVGQVLNRNELIADGRVEYDHHFRLEPEFIAVILGALVYHGDLVVSYPGKKIDAANLEDMAKMSVEDLITFRHVELPKEPPIEVLAELFKMLKLSPGLVRTPGTHKEAVKQLQERIADILSRVVETQHRIEESPSLWGVDILSPQARQDAQKKLESLKQFLQSLQRFKTEGLLKNFGGTRSDIKIHEKELKLLDEIEALLQFCADLGPIAYYLGQAESVLPSENTILVAMKEARTELVMQLQESGDCTPEIRQDLERKLTQLKQDYITEYLHLHSVARLGVDEDEQQKKLKKDSRLQALRALAHVEIMPKRDLTEFETKLSALRPCFTLTEKGLQKDPICPDCHFRPKDEEIEAPPEQMLSFLDEKLDSLYEEWTRVLLENLKDPMVTTNLDLLKEDEKELIDDFVSSQRLPSEVKSDFVRALQEVLSGLEKVTITRDELKSALVSRGGPCTIDELQARFEEYLHTLTRGKDERKIRIVIE